MFNERRFKLTIILTRIRRYVFIFLFVILGLVGAYVLSEFLTEIVKMDQKITTPIMIFTGIGIFVICFILTSNLEFKIQQAQLELKMLRKINLVSFKLDKILENDGISISDEISKEINSINMNANAISKKTPAKKTKKIKLIKSKIN